MAGNTSSAVDMVNSPPHYRSHPSGVEVIEVTRHCSFNIGNAVKYILRHNHKGAARQDLDKALWYLRDESKRLGLVGKVELLPADSQYKLFRILESEVINPTLPGPLTVVLMQLLQGHLPSARKCLEDYLSTID